MSDPLTPSTWNDIVQRARDCPILYQVVTMVERGDRTREEALMQAVLWLSKNRDALIEAERERLRWTMPLPLMKGK